MMRTMTTSPSKTDYSNEPAWWDVIGQFALSQRYLPIDLTIEIKVKHSGHSRMWEIPPRVLRGIVLELRGIYLDKCKKAKFGGVKDGVYTKHEKESGLLKMSGGSWTLNLDDIKDLKINKIVYVTDKHNYTIDYSKALEKGFTKNFLGENKLVIPLKNWKKTTTKKVSSQ